MIEVTATADIDRPAEEVFAFLADFTNNPRWQRGMRTASWTSDPPLRVGSTYEQQARFLGRTVRSTFEVVALEPGRAVTIASTGGSFPIRVTRTVEPLGEARCRASAAVRGDPGRFFGPFKPLLRRLVQRAVAGDYRRLTQVLAG